MWFLSLTKIRSTATDTKTTGCPKRRSRLKRLQISITNQSQVQV